MMGKIGYLQTGEQMAPVTKRTEDLFRSKLNIVRCPKQLSSQPNYVSIPSKTLLILKHNVLWYTSSHSVHNRHLPPAESDRGSRRYCCKLCKWKWKLDLYFDWIIYCQEIKSCMYFFVCLESTLFGVNLVVFGASGCWLWSASDSSVSLIKFRILPGNDSKHEVFGVVV